MAIDVRPNSVLRLLNVSISNDYKNQYDFTSQAEQESFFSNKSNKTYNNLTFINEKEIIVPDDYYSVQQYNYLMFRNYGFDNNIQQPLWYYAFITDVEYINENSTRIKYELDVFQTFYWKLNFKKSFIIREHVSDDSVGSNTVDEGIGFGDYIINNSNTNRIEKLDDFWILIEASNDLNGNVEFNNYDNINHGSILYPIPLNNINNLVGIINQYVSAGRTIDDIIDIYCVPNWAITHADYDTPSSQYADNKLKSGSSGRTKIINININQNHPFGNYVPKNNKLRQFPYSVYELTAYQGKRVILKPELFDNQSEFQFKLLSSLINPKACCVPINYKSSVGEPDTGIVIDNFPHSTWVSDFYKNWVALNQDGNNLSLALNTGSSLTSMAIATSFTNPITRALALTAGASQIASDISQHLINERKAEITPNTVHENSNTMNLQLANDSLEFRLIHKIIKPEFAQKIDDFFTAYGYKVNKFDIPNFRKRENWDYIQTEGINITANIPNNYLNKIKSMFNNGVTFWHNDNVGNYDRTNNIRQIGE